MTSPLIQLADIRYSYPESGRTVLAGVDFALKSGARAGIIGPNGSGKTTLLMTLVGLVKPDSGEVRYKGEPVASEKEFRQLRRGVGFLFQNPDDQLFSPTVLEDVAFGPLNLGLPPEDALARAEAALASLGLEAYGQRITHKLSGGEKRLISLATVLAMEPEALLLDEPTTGLDPDTRDRLVEIVNGLDKSLVVVSHDYDFLDKTTREVWAMRGGLLAKAEREVLHEHVHAHAHGDLPHSHGH
jgi:cobalt/nickel transport system ATP-binding protein